MCCCCTCLSSCHRTASDSSYWTICTLFIAITISCFEGIRTCVGVLVIQCSHEFLRILVHWICCLFEAAEQRIIIVKYLIQARNNVTRMRVEPSLCNQGRRKTTFLLCRPCCRPNFSKGERFMLCREARVSFAAMVSVSSSLPWSQSSFIFLSSQDQSEGEFWL